MTSRLHFFLPILIFGSLLSSALADLDVKLARYGNAKNYRDVRKIVEAYVRSNTLSFPVNANTMGGNPNRGGENFLYIEYTVDGRGYKGSTNEGGVFTFQGIANVRPPSRFPILQPPAPSAAPLRVVNRSGGSVSIYAIDRYGQWTWAENLNNGGTFSAHGQVGQDWVITDARRQVLEQYRVRAGENTVTLYPRYVPPGPGGLMRVRFENMSRTPLFLYQVDQWGGWSWRGFLEPYGVHEAATRAGDQWVATNRANTPLERVTIQPGMKRVPLR
jgi:hypothetical protein